MTFDEQFEKIISRVYFLAEAGSAEQFHIDIKAFTLSEIKSVIERIEELPTGFFDSTPYKEKLIKELKKEYGV